MMSDFTCHSFVSGDHIYQVQVSLHNHTAKNLVTGDDFISRLNSIVATNRKGGDLMSSDKRFGSKGLVSVWRAEEQPSGCA